MTCVAYRAKTTHRRLNAGAHRFAYSLFYIFLDVDTIAGDATAHRLFSYNKFNLFSFHDQDHGGGATLREWAEGAFASANIDVEGGSIKLLALPRVLGFVFNPLSLVFGFSRGGSLVGVIYEVRNTFGEMHSYVVPYRFGETQTVRKIFHVSPFFDVQGEYRFQVQPPDERLAFIVENIDEGAVQHIATLSGKRVGLSDWELLRVFLSLPLMTIGVVFSIHWQALKLWLAGARYRPKPPPPLHAFSRQTEIASALAGPSAKHAE